MSMIQAFNALIELVQLDSTIRKHKASIEKFVNQQKNVAVEKKQVERDYMTLKHELLKARKDVEQAESIMQEMNAQEKEKKSGLDKLQDYKMYRAIKAEIDQLHEQQRMQETAVVNAWNALEVMEGRYDQQHEMLQQKIATLEQESAQMQKREQELYAAIDAQVAQRAAKEAVVPTEWLAKYSLMQARVDDPVVPVESGACSVCFYQLMPTDMVLVRKGTLAQCKGCFRLLYLKESMGQ